MLAYPDPFASSAVEMPLGVAPSRWVSRLRSMRTGMEVSGNDRKLPSSHHQIRAETPRTQRASVEISAFSASLREIFGKAASDRLRTFPSSSPRTRSGVHDFGAAMDPGSSPG